MVGGGQAASTLQQAVLPIADHKSCQSVNGYMVSVDEDSMVCAGGEGKGGCQVNVSNQNLYGHDFESRLSFRS